MNNQQRAAMIRPRGKSEAPHMIAAYRAMQMALEALEYYKNPTAEFYERIAVELEDKAITALREALENNELSDVTLINEGDMAQHLMDYDQWFVDGVEEGLAMAQPQDNLNCKSVQARLATLWGYVKAQPQGERAAWVRINWVGECDFYSERLWQLDSGDYDLYLTPPVVPQGEPVACNCQELERLAEEAECVRLSLDKANIPTADSEGAIYSLWGRVCRYAERTTPPSVEAIRIETLEKAAKVCEELKNPKDDLSAYSDGWIGGTFECAAAIRSMK